MNRLIQFHPPNLFQKEMLIILASLLNGKELKEIRETFAAIDSDSSGSISLEELCDAFKKIGKVYDVKEDANDIMTKIDFNSNGEINYTEFVSGTLDKKLLSKDNLMKVFKFIDTQGKELLDYE